MAILRTERLVLRPIVQNDFELIYSFARNPNIGPRAGWKPHESREETQEIMDTLFLKKETVWAITLSDDDSFRGAVGLEGDPKRKNPEARMIGYWLNEDDWGKGIMTEAAREVVRYGFEELNAPIVTSNCYTFNDASRNVIEKIGLKYEGMLKQAEKRFDDKVFDLYMFSLVRGEYFGNEV